MAIKEVSAYLEQGAAPCLCRMPRFIPLFALILTAAPAQAQELLHELASPTP